LRESLSRGSCTKVNSFTSASLVEEFRAQGATETTTSIYYYYDPLRKAYATALSLIRSFIKQLLLICWMTSNIPSQSLRSKLQQVFGTTKVSTPVGEFVDICLELASVVGSVTYVIDGLHEILDEDMRELLSFIDKLRRRTSDTSSRLAMFARDVLGHNVDITRRLQNVRPLVFTLQLVANDIATFVETSVDWKMAHERPITQDQRLVSEVKETLTKEGEKMLVEFLRYRAIADQQAGSYGYICRLLPCGSAVRVIWRLEMR